MTSSFRLGLATLALGIAGSASAATLDFNFATGPSLDKRQSAFSFSQGDINLTVSAGSKLVAYRYDGLGVSTSSTEAGEFNSYAGHNGVEALTFTFSQPVQLSSIGFYLFDNNIDQLVMTYGSNSLTINKKNDAVFNTPITLSSFTLTATGLGTSTRIDALKINTVNNTPINNASVPVPATAWLLGSGLLGLAGIARRRFRAIG